MIAAEAKWANSACSPQPDLKDVIADDFQGTSPSGRRYDKAKAIAPGYQVAFARLPTGRGKGEILRRLHRDPADVLRHARLGSSRDGRRDGREDVGSRRHALAYALANAAIIASYTLGRTSGLVNAAGEPIGLIQVERYLGRNDVPFRRSEDRRRA